MATFCSDLLEGLPDAVLVSTRTGEILFANREAGVLFGCEPQYLLGKQTDLLVPLRFREQHAAARIEYLQSELQQQRKRFCAMSQDGTEFFVEACMSKCDLHEQGPVLIASLRSVNGDQELATKFQALLEAAPDAIVIVDKTGKIELVNAQAEKLFRWRREQLLGQPIEKLIPRRFHHSHPDHRQSYGKEPKVRGMGSGLDLQGVRQDGTEFPVEISLSPLQTEAGMLILSAIRDISPRKKIEESLQSANRELEAFSYSVAHDLRAPLRGMNGFAQALLEEYANKLDAQGLEYLQEVRDNAVRMGSLIDALLSLSKVARGELRLQRLSLSALAQIAVAQLAANEPRAGMHVIIEPDLEAYMDTALAQTLLANLLGNAWKFTNKSAEPRVEFGRTRGRAENAFFVADNGAGFNMSFAQKLFIPFQRLHTVSEFPGTGIGLATVQRIVHRHGGQIWAEGRVGEGATFFFTLGTPVGNGS